MMMRQNTAHGQPALKLITALILMHDEWEVMAKSVCCDSDDATVEFILHTHLIYETF